LISRLIHIDRNDTQNVPNLQLRTLSLANFTKTRGIATLCLELFLHIFHGTQYQILSYGGHVRHCAMTLVRPSAKTLCNICRRDYALRVDAIKKQLPVRNKVSLTLDGWATANKLAISLVIAYYIDRICALSEGQLGFAEIDGLFYSRLESQQSMTGQGPTYWNMAAHTFEGRA